MAVSTTIPAGTVLSGKYRVGRELGRGGMAAVYAADNLDIGKRVAIKLLAGHLAASQTVVERFLREARAVAKIKSPHICDVYDAGRLEDGTPFLVLELLEGESLYDAMVRDRQMSPQLTLAIILQVCRGLAKAHEVGIVHRDLKPENVFLTVDDDANLLVKILDFGLAKFYDSPVEPGDNKKRAPRLTREGAVFGTPAYMSPEQVRGQAAADTRADLWAVACMTYECFTGTTVWKTDDGVAMTFAQIATAPIPDPRLYRPDLPSSFTGWFRKALDRDIERRFQSVQEFADELVAAFDYEAKAGGLDAGLINQLSREARQPHDDQTTRRIPPPVQREENEGPTVVRPRPHSPAPESARPKEAPKPAPASAPPASVPSGPAISPPRQVTPSAPSPVALHDDLLPSEELARPSRAKLFVGIAGVAAGVVVIGSIAMGRGEPAKPDPVKRFREVAERVLHAQPAEPAPQQFAANHPWLPRLREAQSYIVKGAHDKAGNILKRAFDDTKHAALKNLLEQAQIAGALQKSGAPCQVTGLGRPRTYDLIQPDRRGVPAGPPAIALGLSGAMMVWTDPSEGGEPRAFMTALDDGLGASSPATLITPDGSKIAKPRLLPIAKRFIGAYNEGGGEAGIYLRWLAPNAASSGQPQLVSKLVGSNTDLDATRTEDGGLVVAWTQEKDGASGLYFRSFDEAGQPRGGPVRIVDYRGSGAGRVEHPKVEARNDQLHFVYSYTKGNSQSIRHQMVAIDARAPGIDTTAAGLTGEHALGREQSLTRQDERAVWPALGCNTDGCYVAWHDAIKSGAAVVFLEGKTGKLARTWRFSTSGRYTGIGMSINGLAQLAWYDNGKLLVAPLGLEGPGAETRVAKVDRDQHPPSIAPGKQRGEWYVAWLDMEAGRQEPYAIRVLCK